MKNYKQHLLSSEDFKGLAKLMNDRFDTLEENLNTNMKRSFNEIGDGLETAVDGINDLLGGQDSIAERLVDISNGLEDLTEMCRKGFEGTPTRQEFEEFKAAVLKRERFFAKKLGVKLAEIDG